MQSEPSLAGWWNQVKRKSERQSLRARSSQRVVDGAVTVPVHALGVAAHWSRPGILVDRSLHHFCNR